MTDYLKFDPPSLIFTASSNSKSSLGLQLTNVLLKRPLMFRARMEKQPSCFSISLPSSYGIALHAHPGRDSRNNIVHTLRPEKLWINRVGSGESLAQNCDGDALIVAWCDISLAETEAYKQEGRADILAKAWERARSDTSITRGKLRVPIEIFNPNIIANPRETWKDIGRWTNFIYRPGVENKPARFKPQSVQNYFHGFFERVWDCEAMFEDRGDEGEVKQIAIKEIKLVSKSRTIDLNMEQIRKRAKEQFQAWMSLDHQSVASIIGEILHPEICILTLRYEHSNILDYIQSPGMRGSSRKVRFETRSRLIKEVTSGLEYLHSHNVVHGELHHVRRYRWLVGC
ncbi:hypothetical protein M407DRAFT_26824 [Tulasnella calospora MUT 4182]|uniref:Protein kinase domain-containing protein n=1 Tax=Tulasnella calospora MUT 4182 TaxID=1051891 RepID=A0A0C3QEY1_9AGAM|nr:hypothetical protein M407DRAFT_26824 [Tulasnella calospora MUT 4182]